MSKKGTILELHKNRALIMTGNCDFVFIRRRPDMFIGQQVSYDKEVSGSNKTYVKIALPAVVGIAALFAVILLYFQTSKPDIMKNSYAFVDVDLNPSIELMIDDSNKVKKAIALNKDAEGVMEKSELINIPLDKAVNEIIEKSKESGFVNLPEDNAVLISASLNDKSEGYKEQLEQRRQKLVSTLEQVKAEISKKAGLVKVIETAPQTREDAIDNGISMGRQLLLQNAVQNGVDLTLDEVKEQSVSEIINALDGRYKTEQTSTGTVPPATTALNTPTQKATPKASSTPARGVTNTPRPTPDGQKVVYDSSVPEVSGKVVGNKIVLKWTPVEDEGFQYYKVVVSNHTSKPKYPENGYLYAISDINTTSANIDNSSPYNNGDFGEYLTPGQNYYFSVTAVFSDRKAYGNTVRLKFPGQSPSPTPASASAPKLTASTANNRIVLKWTPAKNEGFVYYKVVISKNNSNPIYPQDGYWSYYSDIDKLQTTIDSGGYNGGDFGGKLTAGQKYYFSITYVYENSKVTSNTLRLTYPGE